MSSSSDDDRIQACELCGEDKGLCDQPGLRDGSIFTMKLYEDFDISTFIPCHARRYVLERLGFEDHESFETRRANLRTKHDHTFVVKVMNAVNNTELGCSNWKALCKAFGFQEDMEITFDLRPEDHIEGNIDIWVDVDMLPVLPPSYFNSSSELQNIIDTTHYTYGSHLTWEEKDDLINFVVGVLVGGEIFPYNLGTGPNYTLYKTPVHRLRADDIRRNILKLPNEVVPPLMQGEVIQNIFSRPSTFDGALGMYMIDDVVELHPPQIWLNVQYNSFFLENKLSSEDYILALPKEFSFAYISSTEIGFLKSLGGKLKKGKTKFIFRFLNENVIEPSTKKTYGELLKDLKSIKEFAAGILVPKTYIWPLNKDLYLSPPTSLVKDAHALGLEVYAAGFANDIPLSYNYSYDPSSEYLQFIDNQEFSVDGVLTDFPPTASGAVACLAHSKGNPLPPPGKDTRPLIITHNGASGMFAGSTDLAYEQAIKDGADIIDCSVRMSKDGVAFCMHSADLSITTTAATAFVSKASTVQEIQNKSGIYSFDLSWSEIQTLKPEIFSPFAQAGLKRNPAAKNAGRFMTLPQFLDMAKASNVSGILVDIENAPYLAKRGLGVVEAVSSALTKAGYDKETKQQVYIQSEDSSVLSAFKKFTGFKRVLDLEVEISGASKPSVDDVKKYADAVRIHRGSVAQINGYFMTHFTSTVSSFQAANLSVFVGVLKNEFMNLGFDFFADPTVEIVTYSSAVLADGLVTDYPATAASYFRSPCSDMSLNLSYSILPAQPGALVNLAAPGALAPAAGPAPLLEPTDVVDPPLPPVKAVITADGPAPTAAADNTTSAADSNAGRNGLLGAAVVALLSLGFLH